MRWHHSVLSEAVLVCPLASFCMQQHFVVLWSLPKALKHGSAVVAPSTLRTQHRAQIQPDGISRQMGRRTGVCRKANQEGTVRCSLTDCKACGLVYCLWNCWPWRKEGNWPSLLAGMQSSVGNLLSCGQHKQVLLESRADTSRLLDLPQCCTSPQLCGFSQAVQETIESAELMWSQQSCLK